MTLAPRHLPPLHVIALEIIERCNLFCDFCVRNATQSLAGIVSVERFSDRIARVLTACPEVQLIGLTGGEPFLHPQLLELAGVAAAHGTKVSITTNGTLPQPGRLRALAAIPTLHMIVSIDGPDASVHDSIRGKTGAFERTTAFVTRCREEGIAVYANMTVGPGNAGGVLDTARLAARLGIADLAIALVKPEGRGVIPSDHQALLVDVSRQALLAGEELEPAGLRVRFVDPLAHLVDTRLTRTAARRGCGATGGSLHIRCDGNVLICTACSESLGSIDEAGFDLRARLDDDPRLQAIAAREPLGGACGSCEFRDLCGGCRCRAAKSAGGFLGGDPLCPRNVAHARRDDDAVTAALHAACERLRTAVAGHTTEGSRSWAAEESTVRGWIEYGAIGTNLSGSTCLHAALAGEGEGPLLAALGAAVDVYDARPWRRTALTGLAASAALPMQVAGASVQSLALLPSRKYDLGCVSGIPCDAADMVLLLRVIFHHVRDGGDCLLSAGTAPADGTPDGMTRLGIVEAFRAAGFDRVQVAGFDASRVMLVARRARWMPPQPSRALTAQARRLLAHYGLDEAGAGTAAFLPVECGS